MSQTILAGQNASFSCAGFGSFISISWEHDNLGNCSGAVFNSRDDQSLNITSSLVIDANCLLQGGANEFIVQCIIRQAIPAEFGLEGSPDQSFSARLLVEPGKYRSRVLRIGFSCNAAALI